MIVIPPRFAGAAREAAQAHESAHVRRRDPLTQFAARLACAVWWFHPLAWIILRRILLEQEKACDDAVLAAGVDEVFYADLLLATARRHAAVTPMSATHQLERRLTALFEKRERRGMRRRTAAMIGVAALTAATAVAAVSVSLFDDPESERLPEVREVVTFAPAPGEAELYRSLLQYAGRRRLGPATWWGSVPAGR